jgi:hypothetical protein
MIKPIPQFEIWQPNKYTILIENLEREQEKPAQEYIDKKFNVKTLTNTASRLISQDFNNGISEKMFELKVGVFKELNNYQGSENSFIQNHILHILQEVSNKYKKTIYLKCNVNIPNVYIPKNYIITPEI